MAALNQTRTRTILRSAELVERLENGWKLIENRKARGEETDSYDAHWLRLLAEYRAAYDQEQAV